MDANHDLIVTSDELAAGIHDEWLRLDRDNNGGASGFEVADWAAAVLGDPEAEPNRLAFDVDFNLTVTPREFDIGLRRLFTDMDRNGDGMLTRAELLVQVMPRQMGPGGGASRGGQGGQGGGRGGRGGGPPGGGGFPG
jgi:hypothetical protein